MTITTGLGLSADDAEYEDSTLRLREELLDLDVHSVRRPSLGQAPEGTRAAEVELLTTLIVSAGGEAISAAVRMVAQWLSRGAGRTAKMQIGDDSIELTDVSTADQRRLLDAFLERHGTSGR